MLAGKDPRTSVTAASASGLSPCCSRARAPRSPWSVFLGEVLPHLVHRIHRRVPPTRLDHLPELRIRHQHQIFELTASTPMTIANELDAFEGCRREQLLEPLGPAPSEPIAKQGPGLVTSFRIGERLHHAAQERDVILADANLEPRDTAPLQAAAVGAQRLLLGSSRGHLRVNIAGNHREASSDARDPPACASGSSVGGCAEVGLEWGRPDRGRPGDVGPWVYKRAPKIPGLCVVLAEIR
jgi:hypothetical protein